MKYRVIIDKRTDTLIMSQSGGETQGDLDSLKNCVLQDYDEKDIEAKFVTKEQLSIYREKTKSLDPKNIKKKHWDDYISILDNGFTYNDVIYQCTPDDMSDWHQLKTLSEYMDSESFIKIRAKDNSMNDISVLEFKTQFIPQIGFHVLSQRQAYWDKVDKK